MQNADETGILFKNLEGKSMFRPTICLCDRCSCMNDCGYHEETMKPIPNGARTTLFEDKFTTSESERIVRLPLWYGMSDEQVQFVIDAVKEFFGK